jgi:signal transduction histidine kinase
MSLGKTLRTTTIRWSAAIALALLVQSAILCGLFYWWTVRQATADVDSTLISDCLTFEKLRPRALAYAVNGMNTADIHRDHLAGVFGPHGERLAGNIATLPTALTAHQTRPMVIGLVRSAPPNPIPDQSRAIACPTINAGYVVFAQDMDALQRLHCLIGRALMLVMIPAIGLAIFLGIVLSIRAQSRFRVVLNAVEAVMAGQLQRRLPERSSFDPFDRLSSSVNTMLDRLEEAVDDLRALGDDIAHELRTPLTRLRARLERGYQDAQTKAEFDATGERALRDIDHALSIVSSILRLREIDDAKRGTDFTRVDIAQLLRDATELYLPSAELRNIAIRIDSWPPAYIMADHNLLMEAVCNLIDNAVKFTPVGGEIHCALTSHGQTATAIRITDSGPGIALNDREAVLRRFHRGTGHPAVAGHGIGLSLVAAIVRLHGFSLRINDVPQGCDITIICGETTTSDRQSKDALGQNHRILPIQPMAASD